MQKVDEPNPGSQTPRTNLKNLVSRLQTSVTSNEKHVTSRRRELVQGAANKYTSTVDLLADSLKPCVRENTQTTFDHLLFLGSTAFGQQVRKP